MRHLQNFVISFIALPLAVSLAFLFIFSVPTVLVVPESLDKSFTHAVAVGWGIGSFAGTLGFFMRLFKDLN